MKKVVYSSFGENATKFTVESTEFKDPWGKTVWVDKDGMSYELNYARLAKVYAAHPVMPLQEGIEKGLYK